MIDKLVVLQTCIRLLRATSAPLPDYSAIFDITRPRKFRKLKDLISFDGHSWEVSRLKEFIKHIFREEGTSAHPPPHEDDVSSLSLPPKQVSIHPLKALKILLPSTRHNISALRATPDSDPTDDPDILGPLISGHWGPIWAQTSFPNSSERESAVHDFLEGYRRQVDPALIRTPDDSILLEAISSSSNSSPGPDGIPFAAWRAIDNIAAPILANLATHISQRRTDLGRFNKSKLFLLPKKCTGLITDTRPICINNTANRIIARALVICITDAINNFISHSQKGFIAGRSMSDHLRTLNDLFYTAWSKDEDLFVLFTDNAKAFDSIHHDFIYATLEKQGFPHWFITTVKNLMTNVTVSPTLSPNTNIPIGRGVKQGCPLSPLLFILAYDPLISSLESHSNISVHAAADDLAVASPSFSLLLSLFPEIDLFSAISGLGLNRDKTAILSANELDKPRPPVSTTHTNPARPSSLSTPLSPPHQPCPADLNPIHSHPEVAAPSTLTPSPALIGEGVPQPRPPRPRRRRPLLNPRARHRVTPLEVPTTDREPLRSELERQRDESCWPNILLVNSKIYLGILFYNGKTELQRWESARAVFLPALNKATARLSSYRSILRFVGIDKGVTIVNTFVTPLFSYLTSFVTYCASDYL